MNYVNVYEKNLVKKKKRYLVPMIAIIIMVITTVFLASTLYVWVTPMSPELYFYVDTPVVTDVTIEIKDGVTKTVPEIPLGKKVTWKNVNIDKNGGVHYEGKQYPFLYYEGIFEYSDLQYGWQIEAVDGDFRLNSKIVSESDILDFLRNKMSESGLYEHEIEYIICRVAENNMLDQSQGYILINYIPVEDVDRAIQLTTTYDFSIMRRHFVISESNVAVELLAPEFEPVEETGFMIHETAINKL